jgi:tetratricopeptide (TPR) repeat protein
LRARLGESLSSIQNLETPFGQATTPSLEAFRAYALGDVEHAKGNDVPEASGHYQHAIDLDPNFAMAWARLGVVLGNAGDADRANECFKKAYELSAHVSESERLYIAAHYYQQTLGNIPKVIETLELATRTYPNNPQDWMNLGATYGSIGDAEKALEATKRAIAIRPDDGNGQETYLDNLLRLDRMEEAKQAAATGQQLGVADFIQYRLLLLELDFLTGDQAGMQQQLDWGVGKPDEYELTWTLAEIREFEGHYREARELYTKAAFEAEHQKIPSASAIGLLTEATGMAIAGRCQDVPALARQALALDHSRFTIRHAGLPTALCGESKKTLPMLEEEARKNPEDTLVNTLYLPLTKAADDLAHHHPERSLEDLSIMGNYNLISQQEYLKGLAYLQLQDGADAATAFDRVLRYKGAALDGPNQDYAQAQLGFARAEVMLRDKTAAKQAYRKLFSLWKTADPDLLPLAQAKQEFSGLM